MSVGGGTSWGGLGMKRLALAGCVGLIVCLSGTIAPASAQTGAGAAGVWVKVPTYASLGLSMVAAGNDATRYWLYFERSSPVRATP